MVKTKPEAVNAGDVTIERKGRGHNVAVVLPGRADPLTGAATEVKKQVGAETIAIIKRLCDADDVLKVAELSAADEIILATRQDGRRGAQPVGADVAKWLLSIHAEMGFAVTANVEQLHRFVDDHAVDASLDHLNGDLAAQHTALVDAVKLDIQRDVTVTEDDKAAMVDDWLAVQALSNDLHACASCGQRDLLNPARTKVVLETLAEKHYLRYTAGNYIKLIRSMPTVELLQPLPAGGFGRRRVDLSCLRSSFVSNAMYVFNGDFGGLAADDHRRRFHVHAELVSASPAMHLALGAGAVRARAPAHVACAR